MDGRARLWGPLPGLLAQLRRLDELVRARATALAAEHATQATELRGLVIDEAEFAELLTRPFGSALLDAAQSSYAMAAPSTPSDPTDEGWPSFCHAFDLAPLESEILLLCLLPECDLRYERIVAYLQDDITCKRPSVDLALNLLCADQAERLAARALFLREAPLLAGRLLRSAPRDGRDSGRDSPLAQGLQVEPRIVNHLLLGAAASTPLPALLSVAAPGEASPPPGLPAELAAQIARLAAQPGARPLSLHLEGRDRAQARAIAAHLSRAWGLGLVVLRADPSALEAEPGGAEELAALARRECLLTRSALLVELPPPAAHVDGVERISALDGLSQGLAGLRAPLFWAGEAACTWEAATTRRRILWSCPDPNYAQRLVLWERALPASAEPEELAQVAGRFRLTGEQIARAAHAAEDAAWQRDPSDHRVRFADLATAARVTSAGHLGQLAHRIAPRHGWEELVLPLDRVSQLREMCAQFLYRPLVFETWGFRKAAASQGLAALFAGPSGTGKTMAAEVIASELALDLYKIDLSGVVSKYIGETEKNLERIFGMARDSNAVLLFDEADALFGKRSETKDAHDRYANIEISYLLQKIEEYDGICILTSNLRQNLDEAFLRRLHFTVEFPMPDEEARLAIWRRTLPATAPVADDVDLGELARRYRFSGGSIRNVLLNAAFLAARDGQELTMEHLLWAARREFQKLGKLVDETQFAR